MFEAGLSAISTCASGRRSGADAGTARLDRSRPHRRMRLQFCSEKRPAHSPFPQPWTMNRQYPTTARGRRLRASQSLAAARRRARRGSAGRCSAGRHRTGRSAALAGGTRLDPDRRRLADGLFSSSPRSVPRWTCRCSTAGDVARKLRPHVPSSRPARPNTGRPSCWLWPKPKTRWSRSPPTASVPRHLPKRPSKAKPR